MPEDVRIQPQARADNIFVPYGSLRSSNTGLRELAELFKVGSETAETVFAVAEREEGRRVKGLLVDPTVTSPQLDAAADAARFGATKLKIANRQGELMFDQARAKIEADLHDVSDPAQVRGLLAQRKAELLRGMDPDTDPRAAGFMEAFVPWATQRIERAHSESEQVHKAQDDMVTSQMLRGLVENRPEDLADRFNLGLLEEITVGDRDKTEYVKLGATAALNYAAEDPSNIDEAIDAVNEMLKAPALLDEADRAVLLDARNALTAQLEAADQAAKDAGEDAMTLEWSKVQDKIINDWAEGKSPDPKLIAQYNALAPPGKKFEALGRLDTLLGRDPEDVFRGAAADRNMAFYETLIREGQLDRDSVLDLPVSGEDLRTLLKLEDSVRKGNNVYATEESKLEQRALRDALKLDFEDAFANEEERRIAVGVEAGFKRWITSLPSYLARPEMQQQRSKIILEKRREAEDRAAQLLQMMSSPEGLDTPAVREYLDLWFSAAPHILNPDDVNHGIVR